LKLVKVGKAGGKEADFRRQTIEVIDSLNLNGRVIFTEVVSKENLRAYYSNAKCVVLPSLYEGFGFPPLEAMDCGCPVITSNSSSLPEVAGEAAIKVPPHNIEGLAEALKKVLTNKELRKSLIAKGKAQAVKFSWDQVAEKTLEVYKEVEESFRCIFKVRLFSSLSQMSYAAVFNHDWKFTKEISCPGFLLPLCEIAEWNGQSQIQGVVNFLREKGVIQKELDGKFSRDSGDYSFLYY